MLIVRVDVNVVEADCDGVVVSDDVAVMDGVDDCVDVADDVWVVDGEVTSHSPKPASASIAWSEFNAAVAAVHGASPFTFSSPVSVHVMLYSK